MEHISDPTPFSHSSAHTAVAHAHSGTVFFDFLWWYFVIAPKNIIVIVGDLLAANFNYFSIRLHLRTLFAYWHRDFEVYGGGFDISRYFAMLLMNTMSRIVGFLIRFVTILFGLIAEVFIAVAGIVWLLVWLSIPVLFVLAFYHEPSFSFSFPHTLPSLTSVAAFFHHGIL